MTNEIFHLSNHLDGSRPSSNETGSIGIGAQSPKSKTGKKGGDSGRSDLYVRYVIELKNKGITQEMLLNKR